MRSYHTNMAAVVRTRSTAVFSRILSGSRSFSTTNHVKNIEHEPVTHTGQKFEEDDYRRTRFVDKSKLINPRFAIDMIADDPVVVCEKRVVWSSSGGALGHPKVFINLDQPGVHTCGYSGRKFVHKKYYNKTEMGPSVTYEAYLEQMKIKQ